MQQSKDENLKKAKIQSLAETPESTAIKSNAIITKASKCSKFLVTQLEPYKAVNFDSDLVHSAKLESPKNDGTLSTTSEETHSVNSAILEFDIGELLVSDISDSEFWNYCQLNNNIEEAESNSFARNTWLSSDQHLELSEEINAERLDKR